MLLEKILIDLILQLYSFLEWRLEIYFNPVARLFLNSGGSFTTSINQNLQIWYMIQTFVRKVFLKKTKSFLCGTVYIWKYWNILDIMYIHLVCSIFLNIVLSKGSLQQYFSFWNIRKMTSLITTKILLIYLFYRLI